MSALRYEGQAVVDSAEAPLFVDGLEGFQETEDKGVAETAEGGEPRDDRLCEEHVEWPS